MASPEPMRSLPLNNRCHMNEKMILTGGNNDISLTEWKVENSMRTSLKQTVEKRQFSRANLLYKGGTYQNSCETSFFDVRTNAEMRRPDGMQSPQAFNHIRIPYKILTPQNDS